MSKFIQIVMIPGLVYALDENGDLWEYLSNQPVYHPDDGQLIHRWRRMHVERIVPAEHAKS